MKKVKEKKSAAVLNTPPQQNNGALPNAATAPADEFKILPRARIRPDPNQPRKTFDPAKLRELADSIQALGIIQPVIVQLVPAEVKVHKPDMINKTWHATDRSGAVVFDGDEIAVKLFARFRDEDFYQIVDGERRWRASELADLAELPCVVRSLEAHKVFAAQWTANQSRENLSALEEGKAFAKQIEERQKTDPKFSKDDLAKELGIARGTVYNRLTLTRLIPAVHEALTAGKIVPTVAGLIAMIPNPNAQEKLLKQITNEDDWQYPFSFRDVEDLIDEHCRQLKDAPFDTKAEIFGRASMVKGVWYLDGVKIGDEIEVAACEQCKFRSGNMKEDFPHIKNGNVCTKPACFAAKCKAHYAEEAREAERKGIKVLTEKEFKAVKSSYTAGDEFHYTHGSGGTLEALMGKHKPKPVKVVTKDGLKNFYPVEEAIAAAKKNGKPLNGYGAPRTAEEIEKQKREREERSQNLERRETLWKRLLPELAKGIAKLKDSEAWKIALELLPDYCGDDDAEEHLVTHAKGDRNKTLGGLLCKRDRQPLDYNGDWDEDMLALWKKLGVDLLKLDKEEKAEAVETLPLQKPEPKQKELLTVKKNKKKKGK